MKGLRLVPDMANRTAEEAADWAIRTDERALNAADQADFDVWLAKPGNADAYRRAQNAFALFDDADLLDMPELDALRREARQHMTPRRTWARWITPGAVAASLLAIMSLSLWYRSDVPRATPTAQVARTDANGIPIMSAAPEASSYATAIGEQRVLVLVDGTRVTMNTGTQLTIDYRPDRRIVRLVRGQALFDVAHNPKRPFSVTAGGRAVTALGTIFEVAFGRGELQVTLIRGRVVVDPPAHALTGDNVPQAPAYLAPGQQFVADALHPPQIQTVDLNRLLLWRQKLIEFNDTPVADAVAELNRYSLKPIIVPDSRAAQMRISGLYRTGDPGAFAELVTNLLPLDARETDRGEIELYPASEEQR